MKPLQAETFPEEGEVVDLAIVRQALTELFDTYKQETQQFEWNVCELQSSVADPALIRTIAAHGAFNNELPAPLDAYHIIDEPINQGGNAA
ncbi:hypothetical protein JW752_05115 [Candidatus Peregrinibacteria bacterium]|nr:hypothetical protein [Candidatus Peregrinibacteria bacterium]